jgi:hypothetical protein
MSTGGQVEVYDATDDVPDDGSNTGPFSYPSYRLLRDDWETIGLVAMAQEIWAILQTAVTFSTGTATNNQTGNAPSTIYNENPVASNSPIVIQNQQTGASTGLGAGTITLDGPGAGVTVNGQALGGGGYPGTVVSGTGNTYQVQINPGSGAELKVVTVTQVQIDPTATIPVGTGVIVVLLGQVYFMQAAVWQ